MFHYTHTIINKQTIQLCQYRKPFMPTCATQTKTILRAFPPIPDPNQLIDYDNHICLGCSVPLHMLL